MEAFPAVDFASDSDDEYTVRPSRARKRAAVSHAAAALSATAAHNAKKAALAAKIGKHGKDAKPDASAPDADKPRPGSFRALGLDEDLCASLAHAGYGFPTPIQRRSIPAVLAGRDAVLMARTGSGKTAAFLAPLVQRLRSMPAQFATNRSNGPRALVVAPTRELALQTLKFFRMYARGIEAGVRAAVVVGGMPLDAQFRALAVCPELVIATPGRLLQVLAEMGPRGGLTLATAEAVVFDEADRLFEGTLAAETAALLSRLASPNSESLRDRARQTVLVSATMPSALVEFSRSGLRANVEVVRLDAHGAIPPTLALAFFATRGRDDKDAALIIALRRVLEVETTAIVFAATHRAVEYIVALLRKTLLPPVDCVHGNMDQGARVEAVARFRKGACKVLVVTDVAARGIDLPELDTVVNYDMPATPKLFVHRVGRAGRAGRPGRAVSLVSADEVPYLLDIHLFLGRGAKLAPVRETEGATKSDDVSTAWKSISTAMESTFLFGDLPKAPLDEEVELLQRTVDDVDIDKLRQSAKNAHGLYIRTRPVASGESVKRSKEMLRDGKGGRKLIPVHPWLADMETKAENTASVLASQVSSWRPKESAVAIPESLREKKRKRDARCAEQNKGMLEDEEEEEVEGGVRTATGTMDISSAETKSKLEAMDASDKKPSKKRARQLAMEQQRQQFFVPLQRSAGTVMNEKALQVGTGGAMNDGFAAFQSIQSAAMDIGADTNTDMLRNKHLGANGGKYWDRVSKKYVKGGVTDATSKRNLHVASREARSKARGDVDYSLGDGVMYGKWLSKNRKAVEELQEQNRLTAEAGGHSEGLPRPVAVDAGLGSNDFRKGAYGRRARVFAAAARNKAREGAAGAAAAGGKGYRPELKTVEEIKKERKLKKKAELRRQNKEQRRKGRKGARGGGRAGQPLTAAGVRSSRSAGVRVITHGKKK